MHPIWLNLRVAATRTCSLCHFFFSWQRAALWVALITNIIVCHQTYSRLDSPMACSWSSLKDIFWLSTQRNMYGGFTWLALCTFYPSWQVVRGGIAPLFKHRDSQRSALGCFGRLHPRCGARQLLGNPVAIQDHLLWCWGGGAWRLLRSLRQQQKSLCWRDQHHVRVFFKSLGRSCGFFLQASKQIVPTWHHLSPDPPWLRGPSFSHALVLCSHFHDQPRKPPDHDMPVTDWEEWLQEAFNKRQRVEQENSCSLSPGSLCLCHPISCLRLRNVFSCIYAGTTELFDVLYDHFGI